ncbi:MAG: hypothetical protein ACE5G5_06130 [Candidatus Methylomirabilales bacterium]
MLKFLIALVVTGLLLWGGLPYAHGQKATEMFIPLGQSPGLSGKYSVIGKIEKIDARSRTIAGQSWSAQVTDRTQIWLDRSELRLTNQTGTFTDLRKGQRVEVKYESEGKGPAEWIKVQITRPSARQ